LNHAFEQHWPVHDPITVAVHAIQADVICSGMDGGIGIIAVIATADLVEMSIFVKVPTFGNGLFLVPWV
jgi:hypothetical protein